MQRELLLGRGQLLAGSWQAVTRCQRLVLPRCRLYCISELDGDMIMIDEHIDDGWSDELMPRDEQ